MLRASDHDDGEVDTKGRNVNLTDLYAFREIDQNPNAHPDDLIFIMNTNPRSLYQQYFFSTNARYEFKITRVANNDETPTGKTDVTLRFEFTAPDSLGRQNMTVTALADRTTRFVRATTAGAQIRTTAINNQPTLNDISLMGHKLTVFAGLREDPFFFDVEQFFRVRAGLLGYGPSVSFRKPGLDFAAGYGVNSIVVRVPRAFLQGPTTATTFDVWETISVKQGGNFKQFERLARPGVNEGLLFSQDLLALFNRLSPDQDLKPIAAPILTEAAKTLKALGNSPERINALVGALLPDVMRIDMTIKSGFAAALNSKGTPIGGRMILDDTVDIVLQILTNSPAASDNVSYAGPNLGGTGHKSLLGTFPYLTDLNPLGAAAAPAPVENSESEDGFRLQDISATVTSSAVLFQTQGAQVAGLQVQIFNLNGKPIFDSDIVPGNKITWSFTDTQGQALPANGMYFYVLSAKGADGKLKRTELRKLVVIR